MLFPHAYWRFFGNKWRPEWKERNESGRLSFKPMTR